jgi:hypothetical protein
MKILDVPKSGRCRNVVAFQSRFGLCLREWVTPRNIATPARDFMRGVFGHYSQAWGKALTQEQRDRWNYAGPQVMSRPRCGQRGPLSGQQFFERVNCILSRVGRPSLWEPPAPVLFRPNPVGQLVITNGEDGARLRLRVNGDVDGDIMVFGQAPCSAGRNKRRNVSYLGLLPSPQDGMSDITDLYKAKHGEPRPGTKVFVVTCQQKNGWKTDDKVTSEIVPDPPEGVQAASETGNSQKPLMHKGSTRGVIGIEAPGLSTSPEGATMKIRAEAADGAALRGIEVRDLEAGGSG